MLRHLARIIRATKKSRVLPDLAREERRRDHAEGLGPDPGIERAIDEAAAWLCRAQDMSRTPDGGVARHFSLVTGWSSSYPETTGYIVPTMVALARDRAEPEFSRRAQRMVDWLVSIQLRNGAFQGGVVDATPAAAVTFNTGQVLFALASAVGAYGGRYSSPMRRAADWLVATQENDGSWRRFPTPFAKPGLKTYETHVAWALLEAERADPGRGYVESALANVRWALSYQRANGWLANCCLSDPQRPLTHTLGYALRGVIEAYRFTGDPAFLRPACLMADGLRSALDENGFLPGRIGAHWEPAVRWVCLTGTVQVAACWYLLYEATGDIRYANAASAANRYVRRTLRLDAGPDVRGGVKGSFPIDGGYGKYQLLNWAAKFLIDSNRMERATSGAAAS